MWLVCVKRIKGWGWEWGGGGAWQNYRTQYSPPPKKTHFDRQQGNPVGIWVRVGLGGSGRAWYLLAVNSAPSVCVCGGGGGAFFVGINMIINYKTKSKSKYNTIKLFQQHLIFKKHTKCRE